MLEGRVISEVLMTSFSWVEGIDFFDHLITDQWQCFPQIECPACRALDNLLLRRTSTGQVVFDCQSCGSLGEIVEDEDGIWPQYT
jgi:hypothetical protein